MRAERWDVWLRLGALFLQHTSNSGVLLSHLHPRPGMVLEAHPQFGSVRHLVVVDLESPGCLGPPDLSVNYCLQAAGTACRRGGVDPHDPAFLQPLVFGANWATERDKHLGLQRSQCISALWLPNWPPVPGPADGVSLDALAFPRQGSDG